MAQRNPFPDTVWKNMKSEEITTRKAHHRQKTRMRDFNHLK
jgi:hypothetical protein